MRLGCDKRNTMDLPWVWIVCLGIAQWMVMEADSATPAGCFQQVDLVVLVDASESVITNDPYGKPLQDWNRIKKYLADVIADLPVFPAQHRVALVKYSDRIHIEFLMDQSDLDSSADMEPHIRRYMKHTGGNTNTADALRWTRSYMGGARRQRSRRTVLLLTDGLSRDLGATAQAAKDLKADGVEVFTVSLDTGDVDAEELYKLASSVNHRIIAPDGTDDSAWKHSLNQAVYGVCGLPVPPREPICDAVLDIALIIDNSGSIQNGSRTDENYRILKEFVKSLIDTLPIASHKTRVGVIRFSTTVITEFRLDTYPDSKSAMKTHIDGMDFEGFDTHISGALRRARTDLFTSKYGDRSWVPNVAIVIADGQSNIDSANTRPQARLLKATAGTQVYVVAVVTQDFDQAELEYIASDPDQDYYFESASITTLPILKCKLLKQVCKEEVFKQCV